jgi:hypothetical protein
MNTTKKENNCS